HSPPPAAPLRPAVPFCGSSITSMSSPASTGMAVTGVSRGVMERGRASVPAPVARGPFCTSTTPFSYIPTRMARQNTAKLQAPSGVVPRMAKNLAIYGTTAQLPAWFEGDGEALDVGPRRGADLGRVEAELVEVVDHAAELAAGMVGHERVHRTPCVA